MARPAHRAARAGQSAPVSPPFLMNRKNNPNAAPLASPRATPRARYRQPCSPYAGEPLAPELTRIVAVRQTSTPTYTAGPNRSPCATATPTGSTVETSAATGDTTLIGPAARPA